MFIIYWVLSSAGPEWVGWEGVNCLVNTLCGRWQVSCMPLRGGVTLPAVQPDALRQAQGPAASSYHFQSLEPKQHGPAAAPPTTPNNRPHRPLASPTHDHSHAFLRVLRPAAASPVILGPCYALLPARLWSATTTTNQRAVVQRPPRGATIAGRWVRSRKRRRTAGAWGG